MVASEMDHWLQYFMYISFRWGKRFPNHPMTVVIGAEGLEAFHLSALTYTSGHYYHQVQHQGDSQPQAAPVQYKIHALTSDWVPLMKNPRVGGWERKQGILLQPLWRSQGGISLLWKLPGHRLQVCRCINSKESESCWPNLRWWWWKRG